MGFLKAGDVISGREGSAFMTVDGRNIDMFFLKNITGTIEKKKADVNTLGSRNVQKKSTGWEGTGSMEIYAVTSEFIKIAQDYVKNGVDTYFTIKTTNEDPTSSIGRQSILLKDVNLDTIPIVGLDVDEEFLTQEMEFSFSDFEALEFFTEPTLG